MNWEDMLYMSGDVFLPKPIKKALDTNLYATSNMSFYISGWTFLHWLSGVLSGGLYLYLHKPVELYYFKLFIIHTIWELWQMLIGMSKPWKITGSSNIIDTVVDTVVFMIGGWMVYTWMVPRKTSAT